MPVPLFIGIGAAIAAAAGAATGARGASKVIKANKEIKDLNKRHEANIKYLETTQNRTLKAMDLLGEAELSALAELNNFADLIEKIHNRPEIAELKIGGVEIPKVKLEEIKKASVGASTLVGGLGGAALGTAGGFAAAGATTAAVMAVGTASTGTAISALSGVAATNATLAALGGGALAAGGGGMALGTVVLGAASAGVGLLIGGIIFNIAGSKIKDKVEKSEQEIAKEDAQIEKISNYLSDLFFAAQSFSSTFEKVATLYAKKYQELSVIVDYTENPDWNTLSEKTKTLVENTCTLAVLIYNMCKVKIVSASSDVDGLNTINNNDIDKIRITAEDSVRSIA